jgi:hypothetical protein
MDLSGKVKLGRLFERTSASGRTYFAGRLGAAKVMMFKNERGDDENEWEMFVQDGGEKAPSTVPPRANSSKAKRPKSQTTTRAGKTPARASVAIVEDDLDGILAGG